MRKETAEFNLCPLPQTSCRGLNPAWEALASQVAGTTADRSDKNSLFWSDTRPQLNSPIQQVCAYPNQSTHKNGPVKQ